MATDGWITNHASKGPPCLSFKLTLEPTHDGRRTAAPMMIIRDIAMMERG